MFPAERHKTAVRRYLEAEGYTQTTDSSMEGHLADMVFLPPAGRPGPPQTWVESKATDVSLRDPHFVSEVCGYLNQWQMRRNDARFHLMVFVQKMMSPAKWSLIFGEDINEEEVVKWLHLCLSKPMVESLKTDQVKLKETLSFFAETDIVEGTAVDIEEVATAKERVGLAAAQIRRIAQQRLSAMEDRSRPVFRRSKLVGNLIPLTLPGHFLILGTQERTRSQMREALKGQRPPPFEPISGGRILTLGVSHPERHFAALGAWIVEELTAGETEEQYRSSLVALLNGAIRSIMLRRGIRHHDGIAYFLASNEVKRGQSRSIPTATGRRMTVAKPYMELPEVSEVRDDLGMEIENLRTFQHRKVKEVKFVRHLAFIVRCRWLWESYLVQILLHRLYTTDGATVIEGDAASRIDNRFRRPEWNRSDAQHRTLTNLAGYLFPRVYGALDHETGRPEWMDCLPFQFRGFLNIDTRWRPEGVEIDQNFVDEYGEESDDA